MDLRQPSKSDVVKCPRCGSVNPSWRLQCEACRAKLIIPNASAAQAVVQCASCGYNNPSWRSTCANCQAKLSQAEIPGQDYESYVRPGCVSAYAVLLGIAGGLAALNAFISRLASGGSALGILLLNAAFTALYILFARGLWQMRNWSRITVIILQTLGFVLNLVTLFLPFGRVLYVIGSIAGLFLNGYIIYWFSTHGDLFD